MAGTARANDVEEHAIEGGASGISRHDGAAEAASWLPAGISALIDVLPFFIFLVDDRHRVVVANAATRDALGMRPEEIVGAYCSTLVHGLGGVFPGCPLDAAIQSGHSESAEFLDERLGRWMRSEVFPTPYRTPEGRPVFLHSARDISDAKRSETDMESALRVRAALTRLLSIALTERTLDDQLGRILDTVTGLPWLSVSPRGAILLVEDDPETLVMHAHRGLAPQVTSHCAQVKFGYCVCGRAARSREVIHTADIDVRHDYAFEGQEPHGHYCVPIMSGNEVLGVMNLYLTPGYQRRDEDVAFLRAAADATAGIIRHRRIGDDLQRSLDRQSRMMEGAVQAIGLALEMRDPYTAGHQRRVARLASAIARELGLPEERVEGIRIAGLLHDIGKISVPAEILSKPGKITDYEFTMIKVHARIGYEILKTIEFDQPVALAALQHHERLDGSGYPDGLVGDGILLEARILGVADVVEAMSSHRPYRPALGLDKALAEVEGKKGRHFDVQVVDACVRLLAGGRWTWSESTQA